MAAKKKAKKKSSKSSKKFEEMMQPSKAPTSSSNEPKPTKPRKSKKKAEPKEEFDQIFDEGGGGYRVDAKDKDMRVVIRQKEACRVHAEKGRDHSVTVCYYGQEVTLPKDGSKHALLLDGKLSLD